MPVSSSGSAVRPDSEIETAIRPKSVDPLAP
jgi:hypothetical protein